jgi:hypothetical protein
MINRFLNLKESWKHTAIFSRWGPSEQYPVVEENGLKV